MPFSESPKPLRLDSSAASADRTLPALLARPDGAPCYHGFPLVPETASDGWCFGAITEYEKEQGCEWGDAFVVAPDGTRAGLVWDVGQDALCEITPPDAERWGIYHLFFTAPIRTTADFADRFGAVLPALQAIHSHVGAHGSSGVAKCPPEPDWDAEE